MGEVNKINEKYIPLYTTAKRYIIVTGGRGSGKSYSVNDFLLKLTYEAGHGILFTRYTMVSAHLSIIPAFNAAITRLKVNEHFNITKTHIYNKLTGSFIQFSGIKTSSGDQTANLKSIEGITTWVIEEGEDYQDEKSFDDIDDSVRLEGKHLRVIWIQNPSTKEHFIFKKFFTGHLEYKSVNFKGENLLYQTTTHPKVEHIHTTYLDNRENLNNEKVKDMDDVYFTNKSKFIHKYIGAWLEKAEGAIFTNWSIGSFDDNLSYCYGQDYGFSNDPSTLVKVAIDNDLKKVYVQGLLYKPKLSTDDLYNINHTHTQGIDLIVADGAEDRLVNELLDRGLNIERAVKGAGSVREGITSLLDYEIIVCGTPEEAEPIIAELNNYIWNDKKSGIPIDEFNHYIDAIRYAFKKLNNSTDFTVIWD